MWCRTLARQTATTSAIQESGNLMYKNQHVSEKTQRERERERERAGGRGKNKGKDMALANGNATSYCRRKASFEVQLRCVRTKGG